MIGRFASRLGGRLPGILVAGVILLIMGLWFASEPLRHSYPVADELVPIEADARNVVELRKRRGAFLRFLMSDPLELRATLENGSIVILYRNTMANYDAVKKAVVSGPATYFLWSAATRDEDRQTVWQLETEDGTVVSFDDTISSLKESRINAALLPGGIAMFGLVLSALGWRARQTGS